MRLSLLWALVLQVRGVSIILDLEWLFATSILASLWSISSKDMGIALDEAKRMNLSLPGLALANQLYLAVKAQGHGKLGTQSLLLALEQMSGITEGISVQKH